MRRLAVAALCLVLLAAPLPAGAQPAGTVWRIGWLGNGTRAAREANTLAPLREGLRELGYVEGKNILVDVRWSEGSDERLARDAVELVRLKVDVIVTHGSVGGIAAKRATTTIPIVVATASDMVGAGLVASLARPGGNVTGTNDQAGELINKNLDVVAALVPGLQRVAVLWHPSNPTAARDSEALKAAALQRGLQVTLLPAAQPTDLARLIDAAARDRARGLIVVQDSWTLSHRADIARLALGKRLPA